MKKCLNVYTKAFVATGFRSLLFLFGFTNKINPYNTQVFARNSFFFLSIKKRNAFQVKYGNISLGNHFKI